MRWHTATDTRGPHRPIGVSRWSIAVLAALAMLFAFAAPSRASSSITGWDRDSVRGWTLESVTSYARGAANQGVTVVSREGDSDVVVRGGADITDSMSDAGWVHIGAPGSYAGSLVDAYQGHASARSIMFAVTNSQGRVRVFRHRLTGDETYHNSFAAISPRGGWLVTGGWGVEHDLQVFADPVLTRHTTRNLVLAKEIHLDHTVRNVQGCTFATDRVMYCSTNDPGTKLFAVPRQILRLTLARPLSAPGGAVPAQVTAIGSVPQDPACTSPAETEGLEVRHGVLRVAVVPTCVEVSQVYTFHRDAQPVDRNT